MAGSNWTLRGSQFHPIIQQLPMTVVFRRKKSRHFSLLFHRQAVERYVCGRREGPGNVYLHQAAMGSFISILRTSDFSVSDLGSDNYALPLSSNPLYSVELCKQPHLDLKGSSCATLIGRPILLEKRHRRPLQMDRSGIPKQQTSIQAHKNKG